MKPNDLNNRDIVGSGQALRLSCSEVRKVLKKSARERKPLPDPDFEANIIAHILICPDCGNYLDQEIKRVDEELKFANP
jgi:hypothetical protein